jgi:hypothetical protein
MSITKKYLFLRNSQLVEHVTPYIGHVLPIMHDSVTHRVIELEQATKLTSVLTDEEVLEKEQ